MTRRLRAATGAGLLLLCAAGVAMADDGRAAPPQAEPSPDEAVRLREELARVQAELRRLQSELARLQAASEPGRDGSLAAQLQELRSEVQRLADELRELSNAVDALSRSEERRVHLTVYGSLEGRAFAGETPLFDGNLVEMVLSARPHRRLSLLAQIEFERVAGLGEERGGEIVMEQAWATLMLHPLAHLRAGVFLVPFGNLDIDHFPHKRDVVTRPLVSYVLAPADWTDNGLGLTGRRVFGTDWLLNYEVYLGAGLGAGIDGRGLRDARQPYGADNNRDKALMGRVSLARGDGFQAGFSGYTGKYDDLDRLRLQAFALDARASFGRLHLTGELDAFDAARVPGPDARFRGFYVRGVVEFGRGFLKRSFLGRDFQDAHLALVAQHDLISAAGPVDGRFERTRERRFSLGLNYRPALQWVLKLGYEWNATDNLVLFRGDADGWVGAVAFAF